ncbi:hypothetical protein [Roseovarius pelagicus]|uniref:Uncharacterized protein n=1 Tax=Roseovarius pelagicus TaxID=2980108 RepID=A0ABY6DGG7_9RHOB|nr:hypothetical protein [Roseovarius pelagicus]UXX85259.1 hypothetical protein N7U68_20660 [Roseovarius pelagicus]
MKRNIMQALALVSAISAGAVAQANTGFVTGHHELPETNNAANATSSTNDGVQHIDRYSDGTLIPKKGTDVHRGTSYNSGLNTSGNQMSGPLPSEAGNDR